MQRKREKKLNLHMRKKDAIYSLREDEFYRWKEELMAKKRKKAKKKNKKCFVPASSQTFGKSRF